MLWGGLSRLFASELNKAGLTGPIRVRAYVVGEKMAKSKFEYVKTFETEDNLLPNCWIVVRVDGRAFHKFSKQHDFTKPNDARALGLMTRAAVQVMQEFKDISVAYGQSDEYSFIFRKNTILYNRRAAKIMSYVNSLFSSSYVYHWKQYFGDIRLQYPPLFDARTVLYPTDDNLRDYLSWRQADVHVNNLYNTTFWTLIQQGGLTNTEAEKRLCGTFSADKNELLFSEFGINYNNEPAVFRKGTILLRKKLRNPLNGRLNQVVLPLHDDMIREKFWKDHSEILNQKSPVSYDWPSGEELPELVMEQFNALHLTNNAEVEERMQSV